MGEAAVDPLPDLVELPDLDLESAAFREGSALGWALSRITGENTGGDDLYARFINDTHWTASPSRRPG